GGRLDLLAAYYLGATILFVAGIVLARRVWHYDLAEQGLVGFACCFGNTVQIGIPLALAALGPEGLAGHTLIVAAHAIYLLTVATLVVEWGRSGGDGRLLRRVVTLPIDALAYIAGPAALFVAGAALTQFRIGSRLRESLTLAAIKIIALPALVWVLTAHVFGLSPMEIAVATIAAGLPTGNNVFILAQRYRIYEDVAASATIISTAASAVTLSILVALLAPGAGP